MEPERFRKLSLVGVAASWLVIGVAYLTMSDNRRWQPDVVGYLALVAAALTIWLVFDPNQSFAYRVGGTCAIGSLLFRMASVSLGLLLFADDDAVWISLSTVGTTLMLTLLYGRWWLTDVKDWHYTHRRIGRGRDTG